MTGIYSNWELSADRANAARRVMERGGLHAGQVRGVRGYADRQLRVADAPLDPRNRRVSVIVEHLYQDAAACRRGSASSPTAGGKPASPGQPAAPPNARAGRSAPGVEGPSPH